MEIAQAWPEEDQVVLVEAAREIQAHRIGVYKMTEEERVQQSRKA